MSTTSDRGVSIALAALAEGRPVVLVDDRHHVGRGDLVVAAESVTRAVMAFVVRHTSGFVCVALPGTDCARLRLPPMWSPDRDCDAADFTVTVDAARGVGTGISASDRAHTARVLAHPASVHSDLTRPGHVVPVRAHDGGVLERAGRAEAAMDLARLAGRRPAGVLAALVSLQDPTGTAGPPESLEFARAFGLPVVSIVELVLFRRRNKTVTSVLATAL